MSLISVVLFISSIFVIEIKGEDKFCSKNRKLLLGGVFNYDKIIFGCSFSEQLDEWGGPAKETFKPYNAWRYEVKNKRLVPIGQTIPVDQILPDLNFFKSGFGLTMKCDSSDTSCKSYRQLVFIFFQNIYQVFRFANDVIAVETDKTKIPWGLKPKGQASDWFFGNRDMEVVNAIMFMGGYQSQIFIVSKGVLYVSAVDINSPSLKWSKLTKSKDLERALGGFVIGSDLFINRNDEPDNTFVKFDPNGKELENISVWKFFGCENRDQPKEPDDTAPGVEAMMSPKGRSDDTNEKNNSLATIIMICVLVVIVLTNIIAGLFWITIYRRNSNKSNV